MKEENFCVNCAHYEKGFFKENLCKRRIKIAFDPVIGERLVYNVCYCESERSNIFSKLWWKCGKEGKFFKKKS